MKYKTNKIKIIYKQHLSANNNPISKLNKSLKIKKTQ